MDPKSAKRPDFAQKLLNDLRMRKQRISTSQNSEKYKDFKRPCSSGSLDLVPVSSARSSARSTQIGDLSMALAFAFRNSKNKPGYLKPVDFQENNRSSSDHGHFPTISQLHVKEISKGAQKLNQILMACFNGVNFDMYSTDIGKELLKGAIDLEESLRMLVELQDASEYMVTPTRKQRVRLVEVDDNEEEIKKKPFDPPRFSFDKPKQKLLAISYHKVAPPSTSKVVSHRREASSLDSRPEKGRISNIIAKLMGLEEMPESKESNVRRQETERKMKQAPETSLVVYVDKGKESMIGKGEKKRTEEDRNHNKEVKKVRAKEVSLKPDLRKNLEDRTETKKDIKLLTMRSSQKSPYPSEQVNLHKRTKSQDRKVRENVRGQENKKSQVQKKKTMENEMKMKQASINSKEIKSLKKLPLTENAVPSKKTSVKAFDAMPLKKSLQGGDVDVKLGTPKRNGAGGRPSSRKPESDVSPATQILHVPVAQKVDEVHNGVNSPVRENGFGFNKDKPLEEPTRSKHGRVRSSEKLEINMDRTKEAETSIQLLSPAQELQKADDNSLILKIPMREEYPRLTESETCSTNSNIQDRTTKVSKSPEATTTCQYINQVQSSSIIMPVPAKGIHEGNFQQHPQKPASRLLTEDENHLKQILINSQVFLNAAEALFGLHIPVAILHSSGYKFQDEDKKLALDCGYEVMKRKGRRQDFSFHPWVTFSVGISKIRCLDNLVKELYEDLETLKYSIKHESNGYDAANTLHEMLQQDIKNAKPDVNCMWDMGWGDAMYACLEKEEVIKDVEKHVLNGLLDEFIGDLLY